MLIPHIAGLVAHAAHAPYSVLAMVQAEDSINSGNAKVLTAFVIIAGLALLAQAIVVVAAGLGALKAVKEIQSHVGELRTKALPLIGQTQMFVEDMKPKIREITEKVNTITAHVEEISALAKDKAAEFSPTISAAKQTVDEANKTVREANEKTREQVARVNGMVTTSLDAAARLGVAIEQGISRPGREVAGLLAGVKVGLETLVSGARAFGSGTTVGSSGREAQRGTGPVPHPAQPPVTPIYPPASPAEIKR